MNLSRRRLIFTGAAGAAALVAARWLQPSRPERQRAGLTTDAADVVRAIAAGDARRRLARGRAVVARPWTTRSTPWAPRSRVCRRLRAKNWQRSSRCSAFAPLRIAFATVDVAWREADVATTNAFLVRLRDEPLRSCCIRVRRAAPAVVRRVVRQSALVAGDRLPGSAGTRHERHVPEILQPLADPVRDGLARGWNVDRRVDARARPRRSRPTSPSSAPAPAAAPPRRSSPTPDCRVRADRGRPAQVVDATSACARPTPIPTLYQESAARKTRDKAITILQGRCVGGGTTVNWTSSFRTPAATLAHWQRDYGLDGFGAADLAPWFERMEARLGIAPWDVAPERQQRGARARRRDARHPPRRRSAATSRAAGTSATAAWAARPTPSSRCWSRRFPRRSIAARRSSRARARSRSRAAATASTALDMRGDGCATAYDADRAPGHRPRPRVRTPRRGAIGTPALLLRSGVPDPHGIVGKRTFLHPTVVSRRDRCRSAIDGFAGAPQTIYSDHFLDTRAAGRAHRLQARGAAAASAAHGDHAARPRRARTRAWMRELPHLQVLIALLRDGFHPDSPGGRVHARATTARRCSTIR